MKFLGFGLFCLLCTVAWAEDPQNEVEESADAQPILEYFSYKDTAYGISLYYKVNWYQAQILCASQAYTLASIPSDTLQDTIQEWIRTSVGTKLSTLSSDSIWISGTNQATTSQYVWHGLGAALTYTNFASNPPSGNSYKCIAINAVTGLWTVHDCREQRYFICEIIAGVTCTNL